MSSLDTEFGRFRSFFWPVHSHEVKKLLPMTLMMFLICFNYSALRTMKDALIIPLAGAEVLPFIKVWAILPLAVLVTLIYALLSQKLSQERVFYYMTGGFLLFYALFAFVLYPLREQLHPHDTANYLEEVLPSGFRGMISMFRYWSFTLFYVMSELWSSNIMTVLFWGFANEITRVSEAQRFYSVLSIASNFAAIAAGLLSTLVSEGIPGAAYLNLLIGQDSWEQSMKIVVLMAVASGILTMMIFRWMNKNVLNDPSYSEVGQIKKGEKKERSSFMESLSYILNSRYLLCIAVIVVAYNLVINLVEIVWKDQLKILYPSSTDYSNNLNILLILQGVISTLLALMIPLLIERFGWTKTAAITPIVMLVTSMGFFGFLFFRESIGGLAMLLTGMAPLSIAVFFGSLQNALSKATKYSLFDTTKEMVYIPLSSEAKFEGKAAIDGVGSRLGKSGGSLIQQGLLMVLTTVTACAPYFAAILAAVILLWILSLRSLGKQFNELLKTNKEELAEQALTKA